MQPFLKWAGGKRWLFDLEFIKALPTFERYLEPFLGGGAGYFAIRPSRSILSDLNNDLIDLYEVVRDSHEELEEFLHIYQTLHSKDHYYYVRKAEPNTKIARAARTLYLNRTCWNGLYRLNKFGQFNVPIGTKSSIILPTDDFKSAAQLLSSAEIVACDFEATIERAGPRDLLFVDPPYTVKHNMNGFVKYNEKIFSWADQIRLRDSLVNASRRGASVIVTNANHASVRELYDGFGEHIEVIRKSVISSKLEGRSTVSELMVRA